MLHNAESLVIPICQMEKVKHKEPSVLLIDAASLCGPDELGSHPNLHTPLPADGNKQALSGGSRRAGFP